MKPDAQMLAEIQRSYEGAEVLDGDGGFYIHIPVLTVSGPSGGKSVAALLRPWANGDGYPTRLFFSEKFSEKGANWGVFNILGNTWHACSWAGVAETLSYTQMVGSHLSPLL